MKYVTVKEEDVINYEFNTLCNGRIMVGIKYVNEDQREKIRRDCTDPMKGKKFSFKNRLFKRMLARAAIVHIKKATYQDINFITEPTVQVILEPGKNWTDIMPYDDEVKEFVVSYMIDDFADFIDEACADVETFQKRANAKEMNNLKPGSAAQPEN